MTVPPSALPPRDRANVRLGREPDGRFDDAGELAAAAGMELEVVPTSRTVAQALVAAVVAVVVLILLVVVLSQGAWLVVSGKLPCLGPGCVRVSLTQIESETGVDFPDGTVVLLSSRRQNLLGDRLMSFEVRIPAGLAVPDPPRSLPGVPWEWQSKPDPARGVPNRAEAFKERGLEEIRWNQAGWVVGVEANGDAILGGYEHDPA